MLRRRLGATRRAKSLSEQLDRDIIALVKKRHAALPLCKRLLRRLRARKKGLQSQDPNIYPLW